MTLQSKLITHLCGSRSDSPDPVTWYRINYAGTQMTLWDFQKKGKSGWTGKSSLVLEVPLHYLRPGVVYSVRCDRILQRAYWPTICLVGRQPSQLCLVYKQDPVFPSTVSEFCHGTCRVQTKWFTMDVVLDSVVYCGLKSYPRDHHFCWVSWGKTNSSVHIRILLKHKWCRHLSVGPRGKNEVISYRKQKDQTYLGIITFPCLFIFWHFLHNRSMFVRCCLEPFIGVVNYVRSIIVVHI